MVENTETKWRGQDASLLECVEEYGLVYQYDGDDFKGWCAVDYDDNGNPCGFAPFGIDNKSIDDYFEDEGDDIARMCGTTQDEMDYEWKMNALMSYYGCGEFVDCLYGEKTKDEILDMVKDNWFSSANKI